MMPLALIMQAKGYAISGSDRAYDQGKSVEKFKKLQGLGITLHPQDGSGITPQTDALITSTAIENTIPDVAKALELKIKIQKRAQCLAEIINSAKQSICVGGTSGKSTVTGMIATILEQTDHNPTVINGGIIENFNNKPECPAASMRIGNPDLVIAESDESDGSIALYTPYISIINNIALDHMSMSALENIFTNFADAASHISILNADNANTYKLINNINKPLLTFGINKKYDFNALNIKLSPDGSHFQIKHKNHIYDVHLNVPGMHNISNALAALATTSALDIPLEISAKTISAFTGIRRRLQVIGTKKQTTVIDDFAHNPDKIAASLATLKQSGATITAIFQPHGFAPLRLMGQEIIQSFKDHLTRDDQLIMPEVYYAGGTVDRSVTAKDIITDATDQGLNAAWFPERSQIINHLKEKSKHTDIIVIMGARDDTLSDFAHEILNAI